MPIAGLALAPVLVGMPPLLLPMHVVLLELSIDPVCSLVFEAEPSEAGAMKKRPRPPGEALFGWPQIAAALFDGGVVLIAVFTLYGWALQTVPAAQARGAAFAALILANLCLALSDSVSDGTRIFHPAHRAFWMISLAAALVLATVLFLPPVSAVFDMTPPSPQLGLLAALVGLAAGGSRRCLALRSRRGNRRFSEGAQLRLKA